MKQKLTTHLLAHGADLRYVQELLGHTSIETTCTYLNESIPNLKRIYKRFHLRENEYYQEISDEYMNKINSLYSVLVKQKSIREKKREYKRSWYEQNKLMKK